MRTFIFIALLFLPLLVGAQSFDKFLAIDPIWGNNRERVYIGDYLSVKLADKSKIIGTLDYIGDSTIVIASSKMHLKEIKKVIFTDRRAGWSLLSGICLRAGLGYMTVVSVNGLINDDSPIVSEQTIKISGGFLAVSAVAALLNRKSIKIKYDGQLKIINLSQSPIKQ